MSSRVFPCLVVVSWCLAASFSDAQSLEPRPLTSPLYVIQPNDVLQIFVWKEEKLSAKVFVRPDGRISFPLIQDMQAAGLNPVQLKESIEKQLKEYIEVPNVTVIVEGIQSYRVYVNGKVNKPGVITIESPIDVLKALTLAGGFQEFANTSEIVIFRNSGEDTTMYRFNWPELVRGRNFSQNMLLKSGDVVVVP